MLRKVGYILALLWSVPASAEPIIVRPALEAIVWTGNAGVVAREDVTGPISWTSTEHLRNACFAEWSNDARPTGDHARPATCVHEDFLDGLFTYTVTLDQIDPCEKAQPDTEKDAGGSIGVWLVVIASRGCADVIRIDGRDPHGPEVQPVPEPASFALLGLGCLLLIVVAHFSEAV